MSNREVSLNRLVYIDIAKAICIILVVIGHYLPPDSPEWYLILKDIIYSFHMPLFMFASGFVYYETRKPVKYKDFIAKKIKRLVIPYLLLSVFIIVMKLFAESNMFVEHPVSLSSFYEIFYLPSAGFFLWFIYVLFLIFLIVPFFNTNKKMNILLLVSFFLFMIPFSITNLFCIDQFKSHFFYFVLGCSFSQYKNSWMKINKIPVVVEFIIFSLIYLLKMIYSNHLNLYVIQLLNLSLAFLGIIVIINISRQIELKMNLLKHFFIKLSLYSYTIYLFHTTFQGLAKSVLMKSPFSDFFLPFAVKAIIIILVGIIGPILLHMMYYKMKNIRKYEKTTKSL